MRRVMVVGQPGSGKSTFAAALAEALGVPCVHIDHIHWQPGWRERPKAEKLPLIAAAEAGEAWVIEGGLSVTWEARLARADTLVWLDRPTWLRVARVLRRSWRWRGRSRPDLPEGCTEAFGPEMREFLAWIWRTRKTARRKMAALFGAALAEGKRAARLDSDRAAADWLRAQGAEVPAEWRR